MKSETAEHKLKHLYFLINLYSGMSLRSGVGANQSPRWRLLLRRMLASLDDSGLSNRGNRKNRLNCGVPQAWKLRGRSYSASSAVKVAPPICGITAEIFKAFLESLAIHMVIFSGPPSPEVISVL